jgi:hypothetical protein
VYKYGETVYFPYEVLLSKILLLLNMITEALVNAYPGAPFEYREVELEDPIRDHEVLVEIKATGVCHTGMTRKSYSNR